MEKRHILLCKRIEALSNKNSVVEAFLMYGIVKSISKKHAYFVDYKDDIIRASAETAVIEH